MQISGAMGHVTRLDDRERHWLEKFNCKGQERQKVTVNDNARLKGLFFFKIE